MFDPEEYKKQRKLAKSSFKIEQVPEKSLLLIKQGYSSMEESFDSEIPEEVIFQWSEAGLNAKFIKSEKGKYTYRFTF
ncbi:MULTISPECIES: hypothetical protein [Companilactobacillus]|uniref:Uncharacterized protein n=2 Tax=Companilactobacillus TaxID=2767879 RepID=A0A0R1WNL4_9LACO|nr:MULTISPECIES: hypothetical protein [Companilactobacillus]AYE38431.1 hypothetical protein D1B17_07180 [Companilactobacillus zhachilii]KRM17289.1 hypothetical protein FD31_GL000368 [Companilactobacillus nantensis DSM 16982]GEO63980.1 hypothetical protein LNA01_11630 [Companilactobacillus nantensis]